MSGLTGLEAEEGMLVALAGNRAMTVAVALARTADVFLFITISREYALRVISPYGIRVG